LRTVFNYPTLAECYKVAALNASNKLMQADEWPSHPADAEAELPRVTTGVLPGATY
ncbi:MAG: hypothetical protein IT352_15800, partial [Gemmatimonadales bacterium]|nr:hypothetical protein [Gemmatimonadales bacterium]